MITHANVADSRGSYVKVNLDNLAQNYRQLCRLSNPAKAYPVVKADAYGLGMDAVATHLMKAGAPGFYVAYLSEGMNLRNILGPEAEIFVLNNFATHNAAQFIDYGLTPILNSLSQIKLALDLELNQLCLQLETGMHRSGLPLADWPEAKHILPHVNGLISHLACADTPDDPLNKQQQRRFIEGCRLFEPQWRSLAASFGIINLEGDYHFEQVRPGIALYGGVDAPDLQPVVTWHAPILEERQLKVGESVGYGSTWRAERPSRIATIGVGYADGYPRALSNKGLVAINDKVFPVIGRVSMDLITVDITKGSIFQINDTALVYGAHYAITQAAADAGTIAYELLTMIGHLPKVYEGI